METVRDLQIIKNIKLKEGETINTSGIWEEIANEISDNLATTNDTINITIDIKVLKETALKTINMTYNTLPKI